MCIVNVMININCVEYYYTYIRTHKQYLGKLPNEHIIRGHLKRIALQYQKRINMSSSQIVQATPTITML